MSKSKHVIPQESDFLLYTTPEGSVRVDVLVQDETVWLTQKRMAALFMVDVRTVNEHIQNIYKEGELVEKATIRNFRIVQNEGGREVNRDIVFYNLDVIIAVGYRVSSETATMFRTWATQTLRSYIVKGFVIDDERLKNGVHFGKDYFDELLEKIREIWASDGTPYVEEWAKKKNTKNRRFNRKELFRTKRNSRIEPNCFDVP